MNDAGLALHDQPLRTLTWGLLAVFAASLVWVVGTAIRTLFNGPAGAQQWRISGRKVTFVAITAGVVARLLAPSQLVMHYMGYELLEQARALGTTPKYGPASFQWQHVVMQLGSVGHEAVIWGHRLLGAATVPLAVAWVCRLGVSGRAVAWVALLVGVTPALVHDAVTESLLVESMTWAMGSAWLLSSWLGKGRWMDAVLATTWALLAMLARPEMLATVPVFWLATLWLCPRKQGLSAALVGVLVGVAGAILWLRMGQLLAALEVERARGNTPRVFQDGHVAWVGQLLKDALWDKNGLLWPRFFPAGTTFAIALGLGLSEGVARRRLLVLVGVTVAWLLPTALDLPFVSVPRVQAPAMWLAAVTGGMALGICHGALFAVWRKVSMRQAGVALSLVWLATAAVTVDALWWQGPAHAEEAVMQEAAATLGKTNALVVARTHDDSPDERVHLAMPQDRFGKHNPIRPTSTLLQRPANAASPPPAYAWLGTRCFMRPCREKTEHPACLQVRQKYTLQPVVQREVTVQTPPIPDTFGRQTPKHTGQVADLDFPWCFTQKRLMIGLYKVTPKTPRQ